LNRISCGPEKVARLAPPSLPLVGYCLVQQPSSAIFSEGLAPWACCAAVGCRSFEPEAHFKTSEIGRSKAEQSNTSVIAGDVILKAFRKLEPGIPPELEVGKYLIKSGSRAPPSWWVVANMSNMSAHRLASGQPFVCCRVSSREAKMVGST
jgi:predicted trehalose synthase